jgi:hypothetical protein
MRLITSSACLLAALAAGSSACTVGLHGEGPGVVTNEEKRFTVSGPVNLTLKTFDGTIEVRAWDQKDVRVDIERRAWDPQTAGALLVNATQDGNTIVVNAPDPPRVTGFFIGVSRAVSFRVMVPKDVTLEARTGDGSIRIQDLSGGVVLNTGDGSVDAKGVTGRVRAHTGDGSIRLTDIAGSVQADSGDGSIDLAGTLDGLTIRTGDGSVRVTVKDGSTLSNEWSISTGDGSIDVKLPAAIDAELDAHTGDGSVRADGLQGVKSDRRGDRRSLQGQLGKGGPVLRLRSGDGSIIVSR